MICKALSIEHSEAMKHSQVTGSVVSFQLILIQKMNQKLLTRTSKTPLEPQFNMGVIYHFNILVPFDMLTKTLKFACHKVVLPVL